MDGAPENVLDGIITVATATCPIGTTLTGGGVKEDVSPGTVFRVPLLLGSYPDNGARTWTAELSSISGGPGAITATAYAVCQPIG
ncbi:hypothetical protein [Actinomadura harenae]|uniref:hypothetical protein n=1 Tax=Actinomadura harenae TaxID=2483351 RepID=UPI001F24F157|nr:hypothetical protein [Actinomadura harenae]